MVTMTNNPSARNEQSYENEHGGVWGTRNASWTCNQCETALYSPADFMLVGEDAVCNSCIRDGEP